MIKKTFVVLAILLTAVGCSKNSSSNTSPTPQTTDSGTEAKQYTMSDVSQANSAQKCWAAINGKVYDLTNWINQHPGGPDKILGICGTDATAAFEAQHDSERKPAAALAQFEIGVLAK